GVAQLARRQSVGSGANQSAEDGEATVVGQRRKRFDGGDCFHTSRIYELYVIGKPCLISPPSYPPSQIVRVLPAWTRRRSTTHRVSCCFTALCASVRSVGSWLKRRTACCGVSGLKP